MEQERFAELSKSLASVSPRRRLLGLMAGGTLGAVLGRVALVEDAEAKKGKKGKGKKNRCKKKNRICQPFHAGRCCSDQCCPAYGPKASQVSVCAPDNATQCCDAELGGGYCKKVNGVPYRQCCEPTDQHPYGYCCRTAEHTCCPANAIVPNDYCCPPGSTCSDDPELFGCAAVANGDTLSASALPKPEPMQAKHG